MALASDNRNTCTDHQDVLADGMVDVRMAPGIDVALRNQTDALIDAIDNFDGSMRFRLDFSDEPFRYAA